MYSNDEGETTMTKRVNIKKILKDPQKRSELIEGAVDFICKVEGIRESPDELAQDPTNPPVDAL
jgi:hypothetical protein